MKRKIYWNKEIVDLFKQKWNDISTKKISPYEQDETKSSYHRKDEIEKIDKIDMDKTTTARDLINLLRARTFGEKGFAYIEENGERIYLRIEIKN